jgi:membrane protein DedA with SNARE-associated domain
MTALPAGWTDPASIGYPALFLAVLLGSVVPVIPTGAVVGGAAAIATTTAHLALPVVLVLAMSAAYLGDLCTFTIARFGSAAAQHWLIRRQRAEVMDRARAKFVKAGWQIIVVGRLVPAGRIPVLVTAGALAYPWRKLLPASLAACCLWAATYAMLGVLSGGIFDSPLFATLLATALVLAVTIVVSLVTGYRVRREGRDRT